MKKSILTSLLALVLSLQVSAQGIIPVFSQFASDEGYVNILFPPMSEIGDSDGFSTRLRYGDVVAEEHHPYSIKDSYNYAQIVRLDHKIKGKPGETVDYTVEISDRSGFSTTIAGEMKFIPRLDGNKGILVEEATGTWCGNCVRGLVGMKLLKETYPDNFVGVAVHYNDPMQSGYYDDFAADGYGSSFPKVTVDRKATGLDPYYGTAAPGQWSNVSAFDAALDEPAQALFDVKAQYSDRMKKIFLICDSQWAYVDPQHTYGYMFAIIENDVHGTLKRFDQQNSMAGQHNGGVWEEIENAGNPIPAESMWYQEVARYVENFHGVPIESPSPGSLNSFSYEMSIPNNITEGRNIELVVVLLDISTREALSAAKVPFDDISYTGERMPLFYCDGTWGYFTPGMSCFDLDENVPFPTMHVGQGDGWTVFLDKSENNYVMASTSYYSPSGTADDWMVTPAIDLPSDNADKLKWRARSSNVDAPDGYEVYVSASGPSPADILRNGTLLFSVDAENPRWTDHEVSLHEFAGKSVFIAFRNNSKDGEELYIDNIEVGSSATHSLPEIDDAVNEPKFTITQNASGVTISPVGTIALSVELFTVEGAKIFSSYSDGPVLIECSQEKSVKILKISDGNSTTVRKIIM